MRTRIFVLAMALAACGPTAQQRLLKSTLVGINAAREGFTAWDRQHQDELVQAATTYEGGQTSLYLYRERREPILQGFVVAYELLALAFEETTAGRVSAALKAAAHVYELIKAIQIPESPPPKPVARVAWTA